ncbi:DUF4197 domain-containing protein [Solemya velesiana gill symbiont]|uniref:DUF4197 domain-containing protein n=1 Tax=Solemya velesiana gill symbiont TaxID=1918948 RepID=A0A1T2KWW9_9GAMM|nr:DUF4197 domain-containing protein [Solemya velesiana gill symbiont]OOZ37246.1 hypothetical protein BOW51_03430 [Solemya velesiana gill symbiont]
MKNRNRMIGSVLLLSGMLLGATVHADWQDWLKSATEKLEDSSVTESLGAGSTSSALSNDQIIQGLKEALRVGTKKAVELLGKEGGYLNDGQVRIPLPDALETVAKGLRAVGQDKMVDEFIETMNRAAEQAVPKTLDIFVDTIQQMSLSDAKGILEGSDTAATDYFRETSGDRLGQVIAPIVKQATEKAGVTAAYKALIKEVGFLGNYVDMDAMDLDRYVTDKAMDGLFLKLAEEEKLIRRDPVARTTDILKTVFGSL